MPKSQKKKKQPSKVWELYKIEGGKAVAKLKSCPKCGTGVFLAEHGNRESCGKCGYTVFKTKSTQK
jgi:small subunit ribosomal protein S27Ae